jgi:hypothetical protein
LLCKGGCSDKPDMEALRAIAQALAAADRANNDAGYFLPIS